MGTNPWETRHLILQQGGEDPFGYPKTHLGWAERHLLLLALYHGDDYPRSLIKSQQMFRAFDDNGKVIRETRAVYRDRQFVVDVAISLLAAGELTLNPTEGASAEDVERAVSIWKRSQVGDDWSLLLATCGDLFMEPARADANTPGQVTIIPYHPANCVPVYGMINRNRLERITVTSTIEDAPEVDAEGRITERGARWVHQRTVDRTTINVVAKLPPDDAEAAEQIRIDEQASGPHQVSRCPVVHAKFLPAGYPEHGLPVTHGLDRPLAQIDSLLAQAVAVGDRYSNPKPYLFGAQLGQDSAIDRFGRWLNIWGQNAEKVSAGYIEPTMTGLSEIREQILALVDEIRSSFPEYLFNGRSTANISAEALQLLASQLERKYLAVRRRFYGALETALAIGVAMEQLREYDPSYHPVTIEGPPLLPANVGRQLEELARAKEVGGVTSIDIIRKTQALGIADPDQDAAQYAELVAEEQMGTAAALFGDDGDLAEAEPLAEETPESPEGADSLAATALNGGQVRGLLDILGAVSEGRLTQEAAVVLMTNAFPTLDQREASRIAAGAIPVEEPEPAPGPPPPPVGTPDPETGFPEFDEDNEETDGEEEA